MNTNRAKLPWRRRYNWRLWLIRCWRACKTVLVQEYKRHDKAARLIAISIIVGLIVYAGNYLLELHAEMHSAIFHARTESAQAMSLRMSGAPKTPEDQIVFKEPVGWKLASNWCKDGWQEECR